MNTLGFRRNTKQRQVILDELRRDHTHPTAAELYECVQRRLPRISLGTVYRNLELLATDGTIQKLELTGSEARFDAIASPHYHVRCSGCGRVDDVPEIDADEVSSFTADLLGNLLERPGGYHIEGHRLEFYGLCPDCHDRSLAT